MTKGGGPGAPTMSIVWICPDGRWSQERDERWRERRGLARRLIDLGDAATAYRVMREAAPPGNPYYRAEYHFMAGWIALRFLNDPSTALEHFAHIDEGSTDPVVRAPDRTLDWRDELGHWLKPFLARLGHKARRQMCPLYVSGLIGPGDRKSIQPMARRLVLGACDQLHHFIAAGVWDAGPLEAELLVQADKLVGGSDAVLVIGDTAIPKKGTHSVGVAAQYTSALKGQQHLPGEEAWLVGEHRASGERKYYLTNLPAKVDLRTLAATIKARWICEQAHQQLKEELGLDHFEGRSWQGLHRHALMTMIAYAFLQYRRLKTARREKKIQRATASANLASRASSHPRTHRPATEAALPALPKMDLQRAAA
jgi:hypothetical protein